MRPGNRNFVVVFSSAGRRSALMECFRCDARELGLNLRVVAVDRRPEQSAACQLADASAAVPLCTESGYVPALLEVCQKEGATLLVPTIDTELAVLAQHRSEFAAIGTRVVVSAEEVVTLARDKLATSRTLAAACVCTPRTLTGEEFRRDPSQLREPVIAKPKSGSCSHGIFRPAHAGDLPDLTDQGYLVQELWRGSEYTVNVFFDCKGRLRCAVPHLRIEVRAGEVAKGRTTRLAILEETAQKIAKVLPGAAGPLCFQAIVTPAGECCVFEINARFGGGYPLAHRAGAQFSKWLLEEAAGLACSANNDWKSGVTMLRYDAAVFIDG